MSVQSLAPIIHKILTAPATDLSTVSAKGVRKQLLMLRPDITVDFMKQNRDAIDDLIGSIFESLNSPDASAGVQAAPPNKARTKNAKRRREPELDDDDHQEHREEGSPDFAEDDLESPPPPPSSALKKPKKGNSQKLTDEEYARQLSSELNQRPSRGNRKSNGLSKKGASKSPKKKKSRPEIDDSDEDDDEGGSSKRKPKKRNTARNGDAPAKGGFAKEFTLRSVLLSFDIHGP
jgi:upstream activation factor subunit UAF30